MGYQEPSGADGVTQLNRTECRALADKWLMLSRRSEGWLRLVQAMAEIEGYPSNVGISAPSMSIVQRVLMHTLTTGDTTTINQLNLVVITRRLTGE